MAEFSLHVFVHGVVMKGGLSHLARGSAVHCEAAPRKHSCVYLEGHELLEFLIKRDCPERMHGAKLEEESL
jgi:hypothetical protein